MKSLNQQKSSNHGEKHDRKVLPEDSDGEKDFHNFPPGLLVEPLNLCFPERSEEYPFGYLPHGTHNNKTHVEKEHQTDFGGG